MTVYMGSARVISVVGALLWLTACDPSPGRRHLPLLSVSTPKKAAVHFVSIEEPVPCDRSGLERVFCLWEVTTEELGCGYLEVGEPLPPPTGAELSDTFCDALPRNSGPRRALDDVHPDASMELLFDDDGDRLAYRASPTDDWEIFYFLDGDIVGVLHGQTGPPDWTKVPDFAAAALDLLRDSTNARERIAQAYLRQEGEDAVIQRLSKKAGDGMFPWEALVEQLPEEARASFLKRLAATAGADSDLVLLQRIIELEVPLDTRLLDVLAQAADKAPLAAFDERDAMAPLLRALLVNHHPGAGALGCRVLAGASMDPDADADYGELLLDDEGTMLALVALAKQPAPCPWVAAALSTLRCSDSVVCRADGKPVFYDDLDDFDLDDEADEDEDAEAPRRRRRVRVCTPAQVTASLSRWEDLLDDGVPSGFLVYAAALQQKGATSPDFLKRQDRRTYVPSVVRASNPDNECELDADELPRLACRMPTELSRVRLGRCELTIDDAKRTVRLAPRVAAQSVAPKR